MGEASDARTLAFVGGSGRAYSRAIVPFMAFWPARSRHDRRRKLMTPDDFLVWCLNQEGKWELVGGEPVQMMAGATRVHDRIVTNLIIALGNRLRGGPCRPTTDDVAVLIPNGHVRRPDVTVDCGAGDERAMTSEAPTVFFEVLSPSTRTFDLTWKHAEYARVPTVRHVVLVDPDAPRIVLLSRRTLTEAWTDRIVEGLEQTLELDAIAQTLPLAEVYADVRFDTPAA